MNTTGEVCATGLCRRAFLLRSCATGLLAAAFLAGHYSTVGAEPASVGRWPAWLLDTDNQDAVINLGNAYLAAHPTKREVAVLSDDIERALTQANTAPADPVVALRRRVRHEYAQGEVTDLNGWVVSVTEARLYALVALLTAPSVGS